MTGKVSINIGTAGWAIGSAASEAFSAEGSALERYATQFGVAEINSSFHRPHRPSTWQRWHDSVPDDFRFSVKIPKEISHRRKLVDCEKPLEAFLEQATNLNQKLAVLLLQLPPKLEFDAAVADRFLGDVQARTSVRIACEPRNESWFGGQADELLTGRKVARVAADPARFPAASSAGGWRGLSYSRLHGSPVMYRSSYADRIEHLAKLLRQEAQQADDVWCIFDNTASSAAISDALMLREALQR